MLHKKKEAHGAAVFLLRSKKRRRRCRFAAALACLAMLAGCGRKRGSPFPELERDAGGLNAAERRLLFAQIVDDPRQISECAILEGKAYKYLLRNCAALKEGKLKKYRDKQATFEQLMRQPERFRGHVVTVERSVIIEVRQARLPSEYGLPGYTVLPALLVNNTHDLYELRILSPPGSKLYGKLKKGIEKDKCRVLRVSGYFMKIHAKRTADPREPPWLRPLLVCPEPSLSLRSYPAISEIEDARVSRLLPSKRIPAPKAEERLVAELLSPPAAYPGGAPPAAGAGHSAKGILRIEGRLVALDDRDALKQAVARLRARLPESHRPYPSGVLLFGRGAPREELRPSLEALQAAGLKRLFLKNENRTLYWDTGNVPLKRGP